MAIGYRALLLERRPLWADLAGEPAAPVGPLAAVAPLRRPPPKAPPFRAPDRCLRSEHGAKFPLPCELPFRGERTRAQPLRVKPFQCGPCISLKYGPPAPILCEAPPLERAREAE